MQRTGMMAHLLRLVPGATAQPEALVQRRLITAVTIILVSGLLQAVPNALRAQTADSVIAKFVWWLLEMGVLTVALSTSYNKNQRRRNATSVVLISTVVIATIVSALSVLGWNALVQAMPNFRGDGPPRSLWFRLAFGMMVGMLHTGVWALAFVFPYSAEDQRLRAVEADKLRIEAEQLKSAAELARLRSQLEPHFLLNTLNAIAGLVTEKPREARRLIACLGDLLRDSLHDADELYPLEDEVAWLRRYAEILESRHAGSLSFQWEIEAATKRTLVPRLLLQPLVENAVKHGALRRRGVAGVVVIRTALSGEDGARKVVCTIEDNGPGLPATEPRAGAFGLRSVRRRLELKFPKGSLRMESSSAGTRSIVELPAATMPSQAPTA